MTPDQTQMRREVLEIPAAVDRLLANGGDDIRSCGRRCARPANPAFMVSVARGSSDHVATYLKYASELAHGHAYRIRRPVHRVDLSSAS